jgi:hypothetical protein
VVDCSVGGPDWPLSVPIGTALRLHTCGIFIGTLTLPKRESKASTSRYRNTSCIYSNAALHSFLGEVEVPIKLP